MFFLNKNKRVICCIILLIITFIYISCLSVIPDRFILIGEDQLEYRKLLGIRIEDSIPVGGIPSHSSSAKENEKILIGSIREKQYQLSLFGIPYKTIQGKIIPKTKVIPLGVLEGIKLYTKGVLVVGLSEIVGENGISYKPYEEAGIKQGDILLEIDNEPINSTEELIACIRKNKGNPVKVKYEEKGQEHITTLKPIKTSPSVYKIGLWVRDSAAGVGTLTFYHQETGTIAALGHGIQDIDTGELVDISSGEFVTTDVIHIEKGEENRPGKIEGSIDKSSTTGKIYANTEYGILGKVNTLNKLNLKNIQEVEVATRREIKTGKASIICMLDDEKREEFEVEIEKIYLNNYQNNKSMIIKITDEELIKKTGGIIQGMSGSPILQNGKLVGALTHVFVSNPQKRVWCFC